MTLSPTRSPATAAADLRVEPPLTVGDQVEFACRLEAPHFNKRVWFRFPRDTADNVTRRADPFVIATLLYLTGRVGQVRVHGAVSDGLLANLADFQSAFAACHHRPLQAPVVYTALDSAGPVGASENPRGITAFSGGVDSCFTVFRHTRLSDLEPKRGIAAAMMVHGFDIPLEQAGVFARSAARSRRLTDDAGIELHTLSTNLRSLGVLWEESFATAVAAALSFFQPSYAFGLIPSFQDWTRVHFDHGSNPLTDPLLSSHRFPIIHDGTSFGRLDKLRQLVAWPAAQRDLRVCWQGEELDRNCCRCEKCLRTMLMLRLCGVGECAAFPLPLDPAQLERLVITNQSGLDEFQYLLEEAGRLGLREPWVPAARKAWRRNRRNRALRQKGRTLLKLLPDRIRTILVTSAQRRLRHGPAGIPAVTPATPASGAGSPAP